MNRRDFLSWVGVGGIASYLPVAIASCSRQTEPPVASPLPTRPDGLVAVGSTAELEKTGQLLNKTLPEPVLVVQDSKAANTLIAVNPTCTHKGCTVEWKADQNAFVCPCHNAKFAPDGKVLETPAEAPLATYPVTVEQGTILVNLKGRSPVSSTPLTGPKQNDDDDDPSQEGKEPRNSEREEEEKSREVK